MDYVTYFIKQNKNKSEKELIDIYLDTTKMKSPNEQSLVQSIRMGLFYIIQSRPKGFIKYFNYLKGIVK